MKNIPLFLLLLGSSLFFVSCNGRSSNSDAVRPLTMDGLIITTPFGDRFEFARSFTSGNAEDNGDVETGAFFYTSGGTNLQLYPSISGDNSDVQFPDSVNVATYQYLAVNDNSGVLTLTGQGVNDLNQTGAFNALNGSFTFFFNNDSLGIPSNTVVVDITFQGTGGDFGGGFINDIATTWAIGNSGAPAIDTVLIDTTLTQASGNQVPVGFNPELDLTRPSRVVPETFNDSLFVLTDTVTTAPIPISVSFQFTADLTGTIAGQNVNETGLALSRVDGELVAQGLDYIAERREETSTVDLTVGGGGNDQDGNYALDFEAPDSGVFTQLSGSGVLLQGRFQVFDADVQ